MRKKTCFILVCFSLLMTSFALEAATKPAQYAKSNREAARLKSMVASRDGIDLHVNITKVEPKLIKLNQDKDKEMLHLACKVRNRGMQTSSATWANMMVDFRSKNMRNRTLKKRVPALKAGEEKVVTWNFPVNSSMYPKTLGVNVSYYVRCEVDPKSQTAEMLKVNNKDCERFQMIVRK